MQLIRSLIKINPVGVSNMNKVLTESLQILMSLAPEAIAEVRGSSEYPEIMGEIAFYPLWRGTLVLASLAGLPKGTRPCGEKFFGFHIHEGSRCLGNEEDPFADTGLHWNPDACEHPGHAGDFPPLMENDGYALLIFYTDRFYPEEILGRTVVIHDMPDDFRTQPSGNSGSKIACGEITGS